MRHHDLIVIGSGSGNSLLTPELEGLDVAIVEGGTFGGTCLNVGCIPTKMFVVPADRALEGIEAHRLGVSFAPPVIDWPAMRDRIFGRIDPIATGGKDYRRSQEDVTLYSSYARFAGERRLRLDTGEEITADRIVVAAGGRPVGLDLDGLRGPDLVNGVHTSDSIMRMEALPPRMAIIGGGFVACEFAHVFAALGVDVIQIQRSATLLKVEEAEIARRYTAYAASRYDLRLSSFVTEATRADGVWTLRVDGTDPCEVQAEVVLLAVGRRPNTDLLDPAAGGLDCHDDGRLVVDKQLRTTANGVWSLGDISSDWQLKHVANHESRIVAHNLAVDTGRLDAAPRMIDDRPVPHAVFGHPQLASFGPTTSELNAAGVEYVTCSTEYGDTAYGWALEDRSGIVIIHASPDGQILAAHCLGPHAAGLIQPLIQAASFGQNAHDVARGQYWIHPALPEVVENALLDLPL